MAADELPSLPPPTQPPRLPSLPRTPGGDASSTHNPAAAVPAAPADGSAHDATTISAGTAAAPAVPILPSASSAFGQSHELPPPPPPPPPPPTTPTPPPPRPPQGSPSGGGSSPVRFRLQGLPPALVPAAASPGGGGDPCTASTCGGSSSDDRDDARTVTSLAPVSSPATSSLACDWRSKTRLQREVKRMRLRTHKGSGSGDVGGVGGGLFLSSPTASHQLFSPDALHPTSPLAGARPAPLGHSPTASHASTPLRSPLSVACDKPGVVTPPARPLQEVDPEEARLQQCRGLPPELWELIHDPSARGEAMAYLSFVTGGQSELAPWRARFTTLVRGSNFNRLVLVLIFVNCIFLAMDDPTSAHKGDREPSTINQVVSIAEYFFACAFTIEMGLRITGLGLWGAPGSQAYLRDWWNVMDAVIVLSALGSIAAELGTGDDNGGAISGLRGLRLLRPLRVASQVHQVQVIVMSLLQSLPQLADVMFLYLLFLTVFGIIAVQLWKGRLTTRCMSPDGVVDVDGRICTHNLDHVYAYKCPWNWTCVDEANPNAGKESFDNLGVAVLTLFTGLTLEGWTDLMYNVMDATTPFASVFFLFVVLVGTFFIINLTLAIINTSFESNVKVAQASQQLEIQQQRGFVVNEVRRLASVPAMSALRTAESAHSLRKASMSPRRLALDSPDAADADGAADGGSASPTGSPAVCESEGNDEEPPSPPSGGATPTAPQTPDGFGSQITSEGAPSARSTRPLSVVIVTSDRYAPGDGEGGRAHEEGDRTTNAMTAMASFVQTTETVTVDDDAGRCGCVARWRAAVREIVRSQKFNLAIMAIIATNTAVMAVAHAGQPKWLDELQLYAYYTFTFVFAVELCMKLACLSLWEFLQDRFNLFDLAVVVVSLIDLFAWGGEELNLSSLRAFRLLQMIKYAAHYRSLAKLWVFYKSLEISVTGASVLTAVLLLVLFIYALLGMQFFGGRFCGLDDSRNHGFCPGIPRANFDSIHASLLSVFQIVTGEDWNKVMYNGMRATHDAAAIYYVSLVIVGNYLVLNLFVAVLFSGLAAAEHEALNNPLYENDRAALADGPSHRPGCFSRSATAVRRAVCCCVPSSRVDADTSETQMAASGSATDKIALPNPLREQFSAPAAPHVPNGCTREDSAGHSGTETKLLFDAEASPDRTSDAGGAAAAADGAAPGGVLAKLAREESGEVPNDSQVWAQTAVTASPQPPRAGFIDTPATGACLDTSQRLSLDVLETTLKSSDPSTASDYGTFLFLRWDNPVRLALRRGVEHFIFEGVVLLCVLLSSVSLALENPIAAPDTKLPRILEVIDLVVVVLFTAEAALKITAYGFVMHPGTYLVRDPWNRLDFFIVVCGLITVGLKEAALTGGSAVNFIEVVRTMRTLRPLRAVSKSRGMKLVLRSLLSAIPALWHVFVISCLILTVFGIMGVHIFSGKFRMCTALKWGDYSHIDTRDECLNMTEEVEGAGGILQNVSLRWETHPSNFDNIGSAVVTLFTIATLEGWVEVMYLGMDAVSEDRALSEGNKPWLAVYFVAFVLAGSFFLVNLFTGVLVERYERERRLTDAGASSQLTDKQQEWKLVMDVATAAVKPLSKPVVSNSVMHHLQALVLTETFDMFIMACIALNTVTMGMEHANQSDGFTRALLVANITFIVIFTLEAVLKTITLSPAGYMQCHWNKFDFAVLIISIAGLTFSLRGTEGPALSVFRVLRVTRLLRAVRIAAGLRTLIRTLILSLKGLLNVAGLLAILFFLFAVVGVRFFGRVKRGDYLTPRANFETFGNAVLLLFRMSTGENWQGVMHDCQNDSEPQCDEQLGNCGNRPLGYFYFVLFMIAGTFVILNLIVAVILEDFLTAQEEASCCLTSEAVSLFVMKWNLYDSNGTGFIDVTRLESFLGAVGPPLGFKEETRRGRHQELQAIARDVREFEGKVHFRDVLLGCCRVLMYHEFCDEADDFELPRSTAHRYEAHWHRVFKNIPARTGGDTIHGSLAAMRIQSLWRGKTIRKRFSQKHNLAVSGAAAADRRSSLAASGGGDRRSSLAQSLSSVSAQGARTSPLPSPAAAFVAGPRLSPRPHAYHHHPSSDDEKGGRKSSAATTLESNDDNDVAAKDPPMPPPQAAAAAAAATTMTPTPPPPAERRDDDDDDDAASKTTAEDEETEGPTASTSSVASSEVAEQEVALVEKKGVAEDAAGTPPAGGEEGGGDEDEEEEEEGEADDSPVPSPPPSWASERRSSTFGSFALPAHPPPLPPIGNAATTPPRLAAAYGGSSHGNMTLLRQPSMGPLLTSVGTAASSLSEEQHRESAEPEPMSPPAPLPDAGSGGGAPAAAAGATGAPVAKLLPSTSTFSVAIDLSMLQDAPATERQPRRPPGMLSDIMEGSNTDLHAPVVLLEADSPRRHSKGQLASPRTQTSPRSPALGSLQRHNDDSGSFHRSGSVSSPFGDAHGSVASASVSSRPPTAPLPDSRRGTVGKKKKIFTPSGSGI